eukprot:Gb_00446 [translate_table: standard]
MGNLILHSCSPRVKVGADINGVGRLCAALIWASVILVFKLLLNFIQAYWWKPRRIIKIMEKQGIKGPRPRFITGNLADMSRIRERKVAKDMDSITHDIVDRLLPHYVQWTNIYGKRFIFWWGMEPRLTISEPELIKELLSAKHGLSYGKSQLQQKGVKDFIGKGLLMANGQEWANQRRVVAPAFHHDNLKEQVVYMVESTARMLNSWKKVVEQGNGGGGSAEIEVSDCFSRLAADIIARTEFGSSYEQGKLVFEKLALLQKLSSTSSSVARFFWPFMGCSGRVGKLKKEAEECLQSMVEARRSMGSCSYGHDLLGLMLSECHHDDDVGKSGEKRHLTTRQLMDECKTFFFAGQDTTSTLLTWTTMLLAHYPDWQNRARQEVLSLGMILNESLRLYTPASLFAKQAFRDMNLGDLFIPKGLSVWIPVLAIHHDTEVWGEDANEFNPDRFSRGTAKACNNPMGFIPFSFGPRKCVGQTFAIMEAKIVLAMILATFTFRLSPSYRHAPISVLTLKPKHGVQIILQTLRL